MAHPVGQRMRAMAARRMLGGSYSRVKVDTAVGPYAVAPTSNQRQNLDHICAH